MAAGVWQPESVLALTPDAASARSGQELSNPRKWVTLGRDAEALWGECQGSGSKPYQTAIELAEPAFHCSCPSRKFPCKHGLGLFLLYAGGSGAIAEGTPPAWVVSWREGRAKRAEKKAERETAAVAAPTPESEAAAAKKEQQKAKRQAARTDKMAGGLDELAVWLADVVRQGLVAVPDWPPRTWDDRARRLVDAQMPALAAHVRRLADMPLSGPDWQGLLLERLARLQLLVEGARRIDALPEALQADLRATLGVPVDQDALRAGPTVRDSWEVLGLRTELLTDDRLRIQRTWMRGRRTGRVALLLDFAHLSQPRAVPAAVPATVVEATLAYYPGTQAARALFVERHAEPAPLGAVEGATSIADAWENWTALLAVAPWTERTLVVLRDVTIEEGEGAWRLRDADGAILPLSPRFEREWDLLARSGGAAITLAGEFDGRAVLPLGVRLTGAYLPLPHEEAEARLPVPAPLAGPPGFDASWRELTTSAVVGVDRRPPNWGLLEPVLGPIAAGLTDRDPPARLLAAAGTLSLYARSGRLPDRVESPLVEPCPADERPAAAGVLARRLQLLLSGANAEFLPEWLDLLAARGGRVPDEALVELLGRARGNTALRPALARVLGRRGHWLARQNPEWAFAAGETPAPADMDIVWQTGTSPERRAALQARREADPPGARAWLEGVWTSEPADERVAFLAILETGLGLDDEPFLEQALDDRSKNVRRLAAGLLARLPASRFAARMRQRVAEVVQWEAPPPPPERGRLAGMLERAGSALARLGAGETPATAGHLVVIPPAACPPDWVRDGMEAKLDAEAKQLNFGERAWWLAQLVAAVPTGAWNETLGASPADLVAAAAGSEWAGALRYGWSQATFRDRDAAWAAALIDWPDPDLNHEVRIHDLLRILPPDVRDRRILALLEANSGRLRQRNAAMRMLMVVETPVGEELARALLARLQRELGEPRSRERHQQDYETATLLRRLPTLLPTTQLAAAEVGWPPMDEPGPYRYVTQTTIDELVAALRFRREMHEEFSR